MSLFFGLLMFICIVPTVLIMFFQIYPKNWKEKKLVLGLKNRDEFKQEPTAETVDKIVKRSRTRAGIITIATCVISVLLLFLRGMIMHPCAPLPTSSSPFPIPTNAPPRCTRPSCDSPPNATGGTGCSARRNPAQAA